MSRDRARTVGWPELSALILLCACVVWSFTTSLRAGRPLPLTSPYVVAPVALVIGVVAGRAIGRRGGHHWLAPALVGLGAVLVLGVLLTAEPGKNPLGYANANAALSVQVVAMSGLALLSAPDNPRRLLLGALALAVAATALNRSSAGVAVVLPLLATIGLVLWRRPRRRWWAVLLGGVVTAAGAVAILRATADEALAPWADRIFDEVRERLWLDAVALWRAQPVTGSGVGSFRDATALSVDPDTSTAHSSVLQVGAETGWVGVALLGLVALAGLLWAARGRPPQAVIAIASWTALSLHSYVDHLLEFPAVVLAAGVVLGWAGASRSEELDVPQGEGPVLR